MIGSANSPIQCEDLDVSHATGCADAPANPAAVCSRCEVIVGLRGVVVEDATRSQAGVLTVTVSFLPSVQGRRRCGVVAVGDGRRTRVLHHVPWGSAPVRIRWRQRIWRCREAACPGGRIFEDAPDLVAARGSITAAAVDWAIGQLRREHATIRGLARQLGVGWWTLWRAVKPVLDHLAAD